MDPGRYIPSIADVTHASREWFATAEGGKQRRARPCAAASPRRGRQGPRPRLGRPACHHPILHGSRPRSTARRELHRHSDLHRARVGGDVDDRPGNRATRTCASASRRLYSRHSRSHPQRSTPSRARPHLCSCSSTASWRHSPSTPPSTGSGRRGRPRAVSRPDRPRTASARGRRSDRSSAVRRIWRTRPHQRNVRHECISAGFLSPGRRVASGGDLHARAATPDRALRAVHRSAIFAVILLAQYRALLATTVVTMSRRCPPRPAYAWPSRRVMAVVAFAWCSPTSRRDCQRLKLEATATTLTQSPWSYARERLRQPTRRPTLSRRPDGRCDRNRAGNVLEPSLADVRR